jgi:cytochrome c2
MFRILIASLFILPSPAALAQDAGAGEKIFNQCKACHMVGDDAKNRVGPVLSGVVGRPAGTYEGYRYGASMKDAGEAGLVWDSDTLFAYLAGPQDFLRSYLDDPKARAKMRFRLADEQDRRDVIAYLASFSPDEDTAAVQDVPAAAPIETDATALCVRNLNDHPHFFAVETSGADRRTATLAPGERLCITAAGSETGMVQVFERADAFEGCSRLVPVGQTEDMLKYVDFDRCFWGSNT